MRLTVTASLLAFVGAAPALAQDRARPIIDMHLHAVAANSQGPPPIALCPHSLAWVDRDPAKSWPDLAMSYFKQPPCSDPIWAPTTDDELMRRSLALLERYNVFAVASGPLRFVRKWRQQAPARIIPGLSFTIGRDSITPAGIRRLHESGELVVFGEAGGQYVGVEPNDPTFEPYLALLEELDIPIGIHIGTGPPGAPYLGFPKYRARMHSPLSLEEPLLRHPKLRLYIMHAGWPMLDDLLAVLWTHPQVYVDVGVIVFVLPRAEFYRYLRTIVEAGFGKRVMFGSDQMVWPDAIEHAIRTIEEAPFLTAEQKRDIFYNNAARFLRMSAADIARHHGR